MQDIMICLITATLIEAEPLIKILGMKEVKTRPFFIFMEKGIMLGISGIGKVNAAMCTTYCCMKFQPGCIINAGAAGAVDETREVGSIFQIEKTIEPDRPHLRSNTPWVQTPDIVEGFTGAVLATQDRPVHDIETFKELSAAADLVDMEGASVLQAAKRLNSKCHIFKFVSDTPLHAGKGMIVENIKNNITLFCEYTASHIIPRLRK
ncbi:MAG: 5'-methylthioadenosine/S-adenosylhomocysteine nucleosidase [Deltaproteobacteria bacterium]|nr:5'-methylthioadenosine/S-adenosylhomocysteine nucleosidase [Deltaproteobacteria bacterium]